MIRLWGKFFWRVAIHGIILIPHEQRRFDTDLNPASKLAIHCPNSHLIIQYLIAKETRRSIVHCYLLNSTYLFPCVFYIKVFLLGISHQLLLSVKWAALLQPHNRRHSNGQKPYLDYRWLGSNSAQDEDNQWANQISRPYEQCQTSK